MRDKQNHPAWFATPSTIVSMVQASMVEEEVTHGLTIIVPAEVAGHSPARSIVN